MSLRTRILLALAPLALLLAGLGIGGLMLLDQLGGGIDAILRENYVSVQAMFRLTEAAERIDSSFQFALMGRDVDAAAQFEANWTAFDEQFAIEAASVTIHPGEDELVSRLRALKGDYRERGRRFYSLPPDSPRRAGEYLGTPDAPGLLGQFNEIKSVSNEILRLNRESMERARDRARDTARSALVAFAAALVLGAVLLVGAGGYLLRAILGPIRAVTEAARAVGGSGHLDLTVPVVRSDELGNLATAFNTMTRELREYRRSNLDRLLRAQRTAQATIDSFPDPVLVVDPGGRPDLANPAARALFGAGPTTQGDPGPVWAPPEPLARPVADALQLQRAYQPNQFDQALSFRLGGEDRTYLPRVRPISDPVGNTLGAAVVLYDVTRFRLLDQFKSDLVATVSHELKTPLTSVRLAVHVLLEETVGPLTVKQTELLIDARDSAERLLALIEQLLALARLQRPRDETVFRPVDPAELLRATCDAARARAEDKHVTLTVVAASAVPVIAVDPDRFGQALGNLVNNAVTYTLPGGAVTLSAEPAGDGRVVLSVADTGVGIPSEHLPHVFERFFRVPGQSEDGGTGLGLAIVKEVVAAHRGEVACESEVGKGTTFRITLPAHRAEGRS